MLLITNISLTERAEADFHRERLAFRPDPGEVFALIWVSSYIGADGTAIPGFEPGYMCGPLYAKGLVSPWALARLSDGSHFYFMPRFTWHADNHYVVDKQRDLFSIGLASIDR